MNHPTKTAVVLAVTVSFTFGSAVNYGLTNPDMQLSVAAFGTSSANSSISANVAYNTITDDQICIVAPIRDRKTQG